MARIRFGSVITDSRGKVDGQQIRGGRSGPFLMTKVHPINRRTQSQQEARAVIAAITTAWKQLLNDTERQDWRTLAASQFNLDVWGNSYAMTGSTLFLRLNVKRLAAGFALLTTAPPDQAVTAPLTASLSIAAGPTLEIAFTGTPAPTNHRLRIYATAPQSLGVRNVDGRYRLITISGTAIASPLDITAPYLAQFGTLPSAKRVFAQMSFWKTTNAAESLRLSTSAETV